MMPRDLLLLAGLFFVVFCLWLWRRTDFHRDLNHLARLLQQDLTDKFASIKKSTDRLDQFIDNSAAQHKTIEKLQKELTELREDFVDYRNGFDITDEFKAVKNALIAHEPVVFVHGGAGVGKSVLIQWLHKKGLIDVKLAPTGLAALNIGGMTIHKFFGFAPLNVFPKRKNKPVPRNFENVLHHANTICIDEISMVRADLLDAIDRSLRQLRDSRCPFGGYQLLLVGDLYQLPPIVKTDDPQIASLFNASDLKNGWRSPWFLDAEVFSEKKPLRIDLTKVFRQQDARFVRILNDIRVYKNLRDNLPLVNLFVKGNQSSGRNTVVLVLRNDTAKAVNAEKIAALPSPAMLFHAITTGCFATSAIKDLPIDPNITLKVGTFVMIVYNDPDGAFVNGSTGIILNLDPEFADVRLKNGNCVRVSLHTWESYKLVWNDRMEQFENVIEGTFTQIPLQPAYAITCHKAQGKTLDGVFLNFDGNAFAPGQTYVALSRTRSLSDISMSRPLTPGDFVFDKRLQEFAAEGLI